ncbi:hypothetical protein [Xanthomonas vasicola]|uniref:hypothetical protein n=1 Tax=Xanthomonas vasicola TaxID=56459 RepID=UPI000AB0EC9D|nr:hypothetical protein [Xanthomonas vasicola]
MIATSSLLPTVAFFYIDTDSTSTPARRDAKQKKEKGNTDSELPIAPLVDHHPSLRIDIHRWQSHRILTSRRSERASKEIAIKTESKRLAALLAAVTWVSAGFLDCAMARPTDAAPAEAAKHVDAQDTSRLPTAPIRSTEQLDRYLANADASSPLALLSPASRKRFIQSLRFNASGVTTFTYTDIEAELSASQACRLLTLFGIQHTLASMRKIRIETQEDEKAMQSCAATRLQPLTANRPQH